MNNINRRNDKLIVHFCYHRVGTLWFQMILKHIAKQFGWKFQNCEQSQLNSDTDIFINDHSEVDFSQLPPYVGSHIIRDPRDMIVSGYFYHLWCDEQWCQSKKEKYGNRSYQEVLNSVSKEEGIVLEMKLAHSQIMNMSNWNYDNPNLIEVKLEDLSSNSLGLFTKIFQKYGFSDDRIGKGLSIVDRFAFEKLTGRQKGQEDRKSHFRKGVAGDWKNNFTAEHKKIFKEMFPETLVKLGYERDDNW